MRKALCFLLGFAFATVLASLLFPMIATAKQGNGKSKRAEFRRWEVRSRAVADWVIAAPPARTP